MEWDVFIAFGNLDLAKARALKHELTRRGWRAFVANDDIPLGMLWRPLIPEAQAAAAWTVALVSQSASVSPHWTAEVGWAAERLRVIPVAAEVWAADLSNWPRPLGEIQGIRWDDLPGWDPAFIVGVLRGWLPAPRLRPSMSATGVEPPSREGIRAASTWLNENYPRSAQRQGLLEQAVGVIWQGGWAETLQLLSTGTIETLLRAAVDDASEIQNLLDRLSAADPVQTLTQGLEHALERRLEEGRDFLRREQYVAAEATFREVEEAASAQTVGIGEPEQSRWWRMTHLARLNRVAALNGDGRSEESSALLAEVRPEALSPRARANLGRFRVIAGLPELALEAVEGLDEPGATAVRQLVALRAGELPEALVGDADVLLSAAVLHANAFTAGQATDLALRTADDPTMNDYGRILTADVLTKCLYQAWLGFADPLGDPGAALGKARALLLGRSERPEWDVVRRTLSLCELQPISADEVEPGEPPAWLDELRAAQAGSTPGEALEDLSRRFPVVGPVLFALAERRLQTGSVAGAVEAASQAFRLLPGHGQRAMLVRTLWAAGRSAEIEEHLRHLSDDQQETWSLRAQWAGASAASDALDRALAWTERWQSASAWAWLAHVRILRGEVREARTAAARALATNSDLTLDGFRMLASVALSTGEALDATFARDLARCLREQHPGDPDAEEMRHQIWLAVGGEPDQPINWKLLVEAGRATPLTVSDVTGIIFEQRLRGAVLDRVWAAGGLASETWLQLRGLPPGALALALRRNEIGVTAPIPATAEWRGRRCLLGTLAIELLVSLDLHEVLSRQVSEVVVFEDTHAHVRNGGLAVRVAPFERELERTAELWQPLGRLPMLDGSAAPRGTALLTESDSTSIRVWLGHGGWLVRVGGEAWQPPGGTAILSADAIFSLDEQKILGPFVDACRARGIALAVDSRARRARDNRADEIDFRVQAGRLAAVAAGWISNLHAAGKLSVLRPTSGPPLPPLGSGGPDPGWIRRAFAAREALVRDPDLMLLSSELVEMGLRGDGPRVLYEGRAWTPEILEALRVRYSGLAERMVTLGVVVRSIAPPVRRAELTGLLARAGYVDAYEAADVANLAEEYGDLQGPVARERLLGLVRWGAGGRHAHHTVQAMAIAFGLFSDVIARVWLQPPAPADAESRTVALLGLLEEMDTATHGRLRLLELAISGLCVRSLAARAAFVEREEDGKAIISGDTPGARMWETVSKWAGRDDRLGRLDEGVAWAVRSPGLLRVWDDAGAAAVLAVILGARPVRGLEFGGIDLSGDSLANILREPRLHRVLDLAHIHGVSLASWLTAARRESRSGFELVGLAALVRVDGRPVRVAIEAILDGVDPEGGRELANLLWSDDFVLARALLARADRPGLDTSEALRHAFARSPLRAVREDPTVALTWSPWADRGVVGPRNARALAALIGEPDDWAPGQRWADVLTERATHGAWAGFPLPAVLEKLSFAPGAGVGAGSIRFIGEPASDETLRSMADLVDAHEDQPAGSLANAIICLAQAGMRAPNLRIGERTLALPEAAARLASAVLTAAMETTAPSRYARLEPGIIVVCGEIVAQLEPTLSPRTWMRLSWRFYGWMVAQMQLCPDPGGAARRLANAQSEPTPSVSCLPDLYDPRRFARLDLRELMVLQALVAVLYEGAVDWPTLRPALLRVATRPLSEDERQLRELWRNPALEGLALLAPDLARYVLLSTDYRALADLPPVARMAWLDDSLQDRSAESQLANLANQTLMAFVATPAELTTAERARLLQSLQSPEFDLEGLARRAAMLVGWGQLDPSLEVRARDATFASLGQEHDLLVVAEWLVAGAIREQLDDCVRLLRAELRARGLAEAPYLATLSRVLTEAGELPRRQGLQVLRSLEEEPALLATLGDLFAAARHGVGDASGEPR